MQYFVFLVKMETVNTVSILSVLHILNISRDIFNKVVIFTSALFSTHRYVCHSKKYHWGCVMCMCVCVCKKIMNQVP